jgi:hypothetical protein
VLVSRGSGPRRAKVRSVSFARRDLADVRRHPFLARRMLMIGRLFVRGRGLHATALVMAVCGGALAEWGCSSSSSGTSTGTGGASAGVGGNIASGSSGGSGGQAGGGTGGGCRARGHRRHSRRRGELQDPGGGLDRGRSRDHLEGRRAVHGLRLDGRGLRQAARRNGGYPAQAREQGDASIHPRVPRRGREGCWRRTS